MRDDVDVVCLTWRESAAMFARFHEALRASVGTDWQGTLLLVENAPPRAEIRGLLAPYRRPRVLPLGRNMGYARAMDLALAALDGRYVALLNSDGRATAGMLDTLATVLDEQPDVLWAAPAVHGPGENDEPPGAPFAEDRIAGTAILVRREALLELGGFDPLYFFYGEDDDASDRAWAAGWRLLRVPNAVYHHGKGGRSRRGSLLREFLYAVTHQTLVLQRSPTRRDAWRRLAISRPRALRGHLSDPPGLLGIAAAAALLPLSAMAAEARRRRPWDGDRLRRWLARRPVTLVALSAPAAAPRGGAPADGRRTGAGSPG